MCNPQLIAKIAMHPELRVLLDDEKFMADLTEIQKNPDALGSYVHKSL